MASYDDVHAYILANPNKTQAGARRDYNSDGAPVSADLLPLQR